MDLDALITALRQIRNAAPASKPPTSNDGPDVVRVYRQLQWFIVNFPKDESLPAEALAVLGPLLDLYGDRAGSNEDRAKRVIELTIDNSRNQAFWTELLQGGGSMRSRLQIKEGKGSSIRSKQDATVHRFAGLLLSVAEHRKRELTGFHDPPIDVTPKDGELSGGPHATVHVQLPTYPDARNGSVSLTGDITEWHVAFTRARTGKYGLPQTSIRFVGVSRERIRLEELITTKYLMSTEDVIHEVCRVVIWYLSDYYAEPEEVGFFIGSILFPEWNTERDGTASTRATLGEKFDIKFEALEDDRDKIRNREAREIAQDPEVYKEGRKRGRLYLYWASELPDRCVTESVVPAVISKWLQLSGRGVELDPLRFIDPGWWTLDEIPRRWSDPGSASNSQPPAGGVTH